MSAREKGNRIQLKLIKELQDKGYAVCKLEQKGKYTTETDAFGVGDLLVIHQFEKPKMIQVTCNRPHTHNKYSLFAQNYGTHFSVEQWVWYDRKGWKIYTYKSSVAKVTTKIPVYTVEDLRK